VERVVEFLKKGFGGVVEWRFWGVSVNQFHTETSFEWPSERPSIKASG